MSHGGRVGHDFPDYSGYGPRLAAAEIFALSAGGTVIEPTAIARIKIFI
jgi:hypothetical protein